MADKVQDKNGAQPIKIFVAAVGMSSLNGILHLIGEHPDFEVVGTALDGEACLQNLMEEQVDIVVVELALPKISGVKVAEYLSLERPEMATVILADQSNLGFYRSAMLAGAREFLITPLPSAEFAFSLRRVYEMEAERRRKHRSVYDTKNQTFSEQIRHKNGKITLISSGKGGVGRSFVCANLAHTWAQLLPESEVAIADFDLQFGDINAIFNLPAQKSLVDLVPVIDELNLATLKSVATAASENLDVFASPPQIERSELITSYHTVRLVDAFCQNYDLTVVNTGALMTEIHVDLMEKADYVLLVANPEVLSVKACAQVKFLYDKLGFARNAIGCVINKFDKSNVITPKNIAESLRMETVATIPFLPEEVASLLNEGRLVNVEGSPFLKSAFSDLATKMIEKLGLTVAIGS